MSIRSLEMIETCASLEIFYTIEKLVCKRMSIRLDAPEFIRRWRGWKILIWQVDLIGKLIAGPPWFGGLGSTWVDRREEKVAHACAKFKTQTLNNPKPKHKSRVILDG